MCVDLLGCVFKSSYNSFEIGSFCNINGVIFLFNIFFLFYCFVLFLI